MNGRTVAVLDKKACGTLAADVTADQTTVLVDWRGGPADAPLYAVEGELLRREHRHLLFYRGQCGTEATAHAKGTKVFAARLTIIPEFNPN